MAGNQDLISVGIIEKDKNKDVLWIWAYPTVSKDEKTLYIRKTGLESNHGFHCPFLYGRYHSQWYYILNQDVEGAEYLPKTTVLSLVIAAKDFHPEKYEQLCSVFSKCYLQTGSPISIVKNYLSVFTKGGCPNDSEGNFSTKQFPQTDAYLGGSLKDVINLYKLETILIYTAILLKKRVVVYHSKLGDLLNFIRPLPALAVHRQNWNILYPFVHMVDEELEDLKGNATYVAGFTEAAIEGRSDLYDVFVNIQTNEIHMTANAKESMAMGKLHKDIAISMVQFAENDGASDRQVIKEISHKTKDLLNNLKSLASTGPDGKQRLSLEDLKERKMPQATENFLYNLAAAEGFVQV